MDKLAPLPARKIRHVYNESKGYVCDCWTEDSMREFAIAERKRVLDNVQQVLPNFLNQKSIDDLMRQLNE